MVPDEDETKTHPHRTVVTSPPGGPKKRDPGDAFLVIIYGDDIGRRIALGGEPCSLGRSSRCEVHLDQESVSRNHARIARSGPHFVVRDLGSTNGTYVNDELVQEEQTLRDGDQIKIGRTIFKFIAGTNVESTYYEEIYRLMTLDGLTELHNKRFFSEALDKEIARAKRYERGFSVVLFDIDHFKKVNDTYGHLAGDAVLRQLGALVKTRLRHTDIAARTGGEEFGVIVPEVSLEGARVLAEKLRRAVEEAAFRFEGTLLPVTISLGTTEWRPGIETGEALLHLADQRLYAAKHGGRNRVA
jgi:two-component system cell cycle response regulator